MQDRFYFRVLDTVFGAGKGVSNVDACYATTMDIEEVLCNGTDGHVHIL